MQGLLSKILHLGGRMTIIIYIDRLPVEYIQIYGTQRTNGKILRIEPNPGI